jgi:Rad3-related DNA helicase
LLEQFRTTPNAVLLATSSFWQGVDVMGDALSCVIIDKLPFASPGDPITAARIEAIADRGGQPFGEYQVPLAILTLLQGLGRLIRHRDDRGVLAVLDPRLQTMGYGAVSGVAAPCRHNTGNRRYRTVFCRVIEDSAFRVNYSQFSFLFWSEPWVCPTGELPK